MRVNWSETKLPGVRFPGRAKRFAYRRAIVLVFLAALPLTLGLVYEALFLKASRPAAGAEQNAAAPALTSGNQASKPALANGANAVRGAEGEVLALCSGASGAKLNARLSCTHLVSAIQR